MHCKTSTNKKNFKYEIDSQNNVVTITSAAGHVHAYHINALKDLYEWLKRGQNGNWVLLGSANEQDTPIAGSVEEWSRCPANPIGGFYGVTKNFRGRFSSYIPAILEQLGFVELEDRKRSNRVKAR